MTPTPERPHAVTSALDSAFVSALVPALVSCFVSVSVSALVLFAATAPLPALSQVAAPNPAPTPQTPQTPVVSPEWLEAALAGGGVAVVDARPSVSSYLLGHVPGAQPLLAENLRSAAGGVPGTLYPWDVIQFAANRLGLSGRPVVVYGEGSAVDATFVASALALAGVPRVSVLDGGLARWKAEKRAVTAARAPVPMGREGYVSDPAGIATLADVKKALGEGKTLLLDVRTEEDYRAGHIPGAKNRYWKKDLVPEGKPLAGSFRPVAEVKAVYVALGVSPEKPVIVYCSSGMQASETFYTLRYRLGHPDVKLYDGSWLEWSITPDVPKETSAAGETAPATPPAVKR